MDARKEEEGLPWCCCMATRSISWQFHTQWPVMKCLVAVVSAQCSLSMKYITKATHKGEQKVVWMDLNAP
jgi:hypothetical protein